MSDLYFESEKNRFLDRVPLVNPAYVPESKSLFNSLSSHSTHVSLLFDARKKASAASSQPPYWKLCEFSNKMFFLFLGIFRSYGRIILPHRNWYSQDMFYIVHAKIMTYYGYSPFVGCVFRAHLEFSHKKIFVWNFRVVLIRYFFRKMTRTFHNSPHLLLFALIQHRMV